ncbi:OLC1v1023120C2 [Oldenlandia corymbosa var. corymbosa]|uniref:Protein yippee-like n=2 Tax=Oldenlandia corymbosa var. corymbosa TaxID=529605 RepID=A0AAV1BZK6_OLDCO|nr:OLC1v1023120C2 [Oldenlandia corymbosa var. corymbosa]
MADSHFSDASFSVESELIIEMGRIFVVDLEGRTYRCKFCKTHLALADDLVSRAFHCRRGKAYLFNKAVNITIGPHEERLMLSGMHTVADIFCCCCGQIVGWKYEAAHEKSQKYKEGKFVLERGRIVDGLDSEFFIDTRPSMSDDAEDS